MNIVCAGFGGQGVLTAGLILGELACSLGKNVTWLPSYGSEMRGGTANCMIKIAEGRIASPFVREIDVLLAMNAPSLDKFVPMMKDGGTVIVNAALCTGFDFPEGLRAVWIHAAGIADAEGNPRAQNLVMLGALAKSGAVFSLEEIQAGAAEYFERKGGNDPRNAVCVLRGSEEAAG